MPKHLFYSLAVLGVAVLAILTFNLKDRFLPAANGANNFVLGDLVKLANEPAVYLVGSDGKRYVFPNESVYYSWYKASDFNNVKIISASEMASLPIGGNITIRPGTKLVKITTDPKVYAITDSGLRWVSSEAIALELYGPDWAKRVVDVSDAFWVNYSFGEPISSAVHPEGTLVKNTTTGTVYLMKENGQADVFNSYSSFSGNGFKDEDIIETTKSYESTGNGINQFDNNLRYPKTTQSSGGGDDDQSQCSSGETKNYTCPDNTQVFWCNCQSGQWSCIISPENQCPEEQNNNCIDLDGDGYGKSGSTGCKYSAVDCNDNTSAISPGNSEACGDNTDNNCNGQVDENCQSQDCTNGETKQCGPSTDTGACQYGTQTCSNGQWGSCIGAVYPTTEICTNNIDDDCDGQVNETCYCSDNTYYGQCSTTKPKYCNNGTLENKCSTCGCPTGQQCQSNGSCITCTDNDGDGYYTQGGGCGSIDCNDNNASVHPGATELCTNNTDDDCDGQINENCSIVNHPLIKVFIAKDLSFYVVGDNCTGDNCCYAANTYWGKNANYKGIKTTDDSYKNYQKYQLVTLGYTSQEITTAKAQIEIMRQKIVDYTNNHIQPIIEYVELTGTVNSGNPYAICNQIQGPLEMKNMMWPYLDKTEDFVIWISSEKDKISGGTVPFGFGGMAWWPGEQGFRTGFAMTPYYSNNSFPFHEWLHTLDFALYQISYINDIYNNGYPVCGQDSGNPYDWFPNADTCTTDPDYTDCGAGTCASGPDLFYKHMLEEHWNPAWYLIGNHCNNNVKDFNETGVDTGGSCS